MPCQFCIAGNTMCLSCRAKELESRTQARLAELHQRRAGDSEFHLTLRDLALLRHHHNDVNYWRGQGFKLDQLGFTEHDRDWEH